jgi:peroxiredoxin Q/BCP
LADPERALCQHYGVWRLRERDGRQFMGVVRTTFLIDRQGILRRIYPVVEIDGHADQVLKDIATLE